MWMRWPCLPVPFGRIWPKGAWRFWPRISIWAWPKRRCWMWPPFAPAPPAQTILMGPSCDCFTDPRFETGHPRWRGFWAWAVVFSDRGCVGALWRWPRDGAAFGDCAGHFMGGGAAGLPFVAGPNFCAGLGRWQPRFAGHQPPADGGGGQCKGAGALADHWPALGAGRACAGGAVEPAGIWHMAADLVAGLGHAGIVGDRHVWRGADRWVKARRFVAVASGFTALCAYIDFRRRGGTPGGCGYGYGNAPADVGGYHLRHHRAFAFCIGCGTKGEPALRGRKHHAARHVLEGIYG